MLSSLKDQSLEHQDVSGIPPDGASDGQCGLSLITTLVAEKVDTCNLHQLQRAVLVALGLTGATCKNPEAKSNLRKHNRIVMLGNQNLKVPASINSYQKAAGVPDHKFLGMQKTCVTRWGNQFIQLDRNLLLRIAIDPSVDKYKKDNKGEKEAIIENDLSDGASKVGKAVAASDIGLNSADWDVSQELAGFLEYPFQVKEIIEKGNGTCTGAQALQLLHDLKDNHCKPEAGLSIKTFPATLNVEDRNRVTEVKSADDLGSAAETARELMKAELKARCFDLRPSNMRLVQCYMSKQPGFDCKNYLSDAQYQLAETLYKQMIRAAVDIAPKMIEPAVKKIKVEEKLVAGSPLFKGASNLSSGDALKVT